VDTLSVNNIINNALREAGAESAYQGENSAARQFALDYLNDILSEMGLIGDKIPYQAELSFTLGANQQSITIGTAAGSDVVTAHNLVELDYVKIAVDDFYYPLAIINSNIVGTNITSETITGRPTQVFVSPQANQWVLEFFPTPDRQYSIEMRFKYTISTVDYGDTIDLPRSYREYLVLSLAKRVIRSTRLTTWTPEMEMALREQKKNIQAAAVKDFSVRTRPPITHYDWFYTQRLGVISS